MTMRSVGVMQEITRAEKREANAARFEREADKSAAQRIADIATIRRDSALAWLDRYYAEAMQGVLDAQRRIAQTEIEAAESAYRGGRGSSTDVVAAHAALVALDDRASDARRRAGTARIALARYLGDEAQSPLAGTPPIDDLPLGTGNVDADIAHHPQITVLDRREAVAAAEVKAAQAARTPDWSVEVMYSLRGSAYSNMISVGVSVPLPWDRAHRQDREVAARLAMLDEVRAEREDMLRAYAAEVQAMFEEWRVGRERGQRYARELVPLATARTETTLAAYRGARAGLADVLAARRNEIDVRMQELQLEWDTARRWAQLNFLVVDDAASRESPLARGGR
jgi:outer membrane protein TolC